MSERYEKKPYYLVNKRSGLVVSSVELMSDKEADERNEKIAAFISENIEWVSGADIDRLYDRV